MVAENCASRFRKIPLFLGILLILFGLFGASACAYGFFYLDSLAVPSYDLSFVPDRLDQVSKTLDQSSEAASNMQNTFNDAHTSVDTASNYLGSVSRDLNTFASKLDFNIPPTTWCPLCGPADYMSDSASSLGDVSYHLSETGDSLQANAQDMQTLSSDLNQVSSEVSSLSSEFQNSNLMDQLRQQAYAARGMAKIASVYLVVLHLAFVFIGAGFIFLSRF